MKICVLGSGALGSTIGGFLSAAGSDVCLIDSCREHVDAMRTRGLTLREDAVDRTVRVDARWSTEGMTAVDLIILLVKSFHTSEAIAGAGTAMGPETTVLSLQNGLGHEEVIGRLVGDECVLAGKTYVGAVLLAPGHVLAGVKGKETFIGELGGSVTDRVQRIAAEFSRAGLKTTASANIRGTMWDKLLINVATGALSAITRLPYGALYRVPEVRDCALAAVAEAIAVATALGVTLSSIRPEDAWSLAAEGMPHDFRTSMLQSIEKGAATEIDFTHGAVVRWGERCGVPTPVNRALVACIKGIESGLPRTVVQPGANLFGR